MPGKLVILGWCKAGRFRRLSGSSDRLWWRRTVDHLRLGHEQRLWIEVHAFELLQASRVDRHEHDILDTKDLEQLNRKGAHRR